MIRREPLSVDFILCCKSGDVFGLKRHDGIPFMITIVSNEDGMIYYEERWISGTSQHGYDHHTLDLFIKNNVFELYSPLTDDELSSISITEGMVIDDDNVVVRADDSFVDIRHMFTRGGIQLSR